MTSSLIVRLLGALIIVFLDIIDKTLNAARWTYLHCIMCNARLTVIFDSFLLVLKTELFGIAVRDGHHKSVLMAAVICLSFILILFFSSV